LKTIVLITTGQPSVNPRIVKEAHALYLAGYNVTLLYCFWIKWAEDADQTLLKNAKWKYRFIGGSPSKYRVLYFLTRARFKINKELNKKFGNWFLFAERSQARCYDELLRAARSIKADWYVGHNLGSLAVAVKAAAYNGGATGFDFEDYHREENAHMPEYDRKKTIYLEEKYVPYLSYISTASPLITERIKLNFPTYSTPVITLLNCFSLSQCPSQLRAVTEESKLHLFWFSQTIGENRGLETVLAAMKQLKLPDIHLTLAGRYDERMKNFINEYAKDISNCIHIAGIIPPDTLASFASQFDIGLATEPGIPLNRDICLTNKIFTYLLAGNCILASDTTAQKDFFKSYHDVGLIYKNNDVNDLAQQLTKLYSDRMLLKQLKQRSHELAVSSMNWENESQKLIQVVSA
jgi:glycosyltransferase involved in cell wall biosynthesis